MPQKPIFPLIALCLLVVVALSTCASGGGGSNSGGFGKVENADIEVFPQLGHNGYIFSVAFSSDGKYIVSGSGEWTIKIWETSTGREIRTFLGHTGPVNSVCFSPDGKWVLSGAGERNSVDSTIKLWDIVTGQEIKTFSGHTSQVNSVCFSPDRKQILSGSSDNTIKLWDIESGHEIRTFSGHTNGVTSVSFSPDGKQILSGSGDKTLKLWDAITGEEVRAFIGHTSTVSSISFSPDGKQILSGSGDKTVKLWNIATDQDVGTFGHTNYVTSVSFSPDGKQILSGSYDKTVKLWDTATGREIRTFTGHSRQVTSATFSPDGRQVLSSPDAGSIKLWDAVSGQEIRTFEGHISIVDSVCFSPDGKQFLSTSRNIIVSNNSTVKLWDIAMGREVRTLTGQEINTFEVSGKLASFSPDGKQVLSFSSYENTVKLRETATGKEICTFVGHTHYITSVSFSPDGKQVLSSSQDGTIKLWDTTGRELKTFSGHIHSVCSASFSPNGKQILSGSEDGTVRLWDVSTGKEIAQFISFSGEDSQLTATTRGLTVEAVTSATSNEGEWVVITPDGFYQASPRGDRYLNVRVGNTVSGIDSYHDIFYNPDVVQARLQGKPDPASKAKTTIQQAASFKPPTVTIQSPANFSATTTATANLSVNIVDQNQPLKNIKVFVNGRSAGKNQLAAIKGSGLKAEQTTITVTGSQKTASFTMPLELDPGENRIEVVASNSYGADTRRSVNVTYNEPSGTRPALPNLWILAVGVNSYQDANIQNLNFCVADAKGVIASLKAQKGKRYGKVNALLIADEEDISPTAANIKQNLTFLDQAGDRDVVLFFLAGHGVSNNGKFMFLPGDTRINANKSLDEKSCLLDSDIVKVLEGQGNRLLFIDACNSGGVDNDRMVHVLQRSNAFVFAASQGHEYSYEDPILGHGYFTDSIMKAIGGDPAALAEGNVSVLSLSGFVRNDVPRRVREKYGKEQNPKLYSLQSADFPMAVIK